MVTASATRPLNGIRAVSLAVNLPGPLAAARLRELGAAVTKVEPPTGDPLAIAAPDWYRRLTIGQRVVALDVKAQGDREKLDELLTGADLLLTSMRPSALARLGLAEPQRAHPRLSLIEIVGHDGNRAETPGHDLNYQAAQGTLSPPAMPLVPLADVLGAERAVSTALAALVARAGSGAGGAYRVVLEEAAARAADAARFGLTCHGAPLGGAFPGYGIYATSDGYVALGAIEPHFWLRTIDVFGVNGTRKSLQDRFATSTTADLETLAAEHDIPLNAVRDASTDGR